MRRFIRAYDIREGDIVLFGDDDIEERPAWVVAIMSENLQLKFTFKYRSEDETTRRGFDTHVCPRRTRCLLLRRKKK